MPKFEPGNTLRRTHGHTKPGNRETREYRTWLNMKTRCFNPNASDYHLYGGRGITVCAEWRHDFLAFFTYIGPRPSAEYSIDRIDVDGDYRPSTVRWADRKTQARNKRPRRKTTT